VKEQVQIFIKGYQHSTVTAFAAIKHIWIDSGVKKWLNEHHWQRMVECPLLSNTEGSIEQVHSLVLSATGEWLSEVANQLQISHICSMAFTFMQVIQKVSSDRLLEKKQNKNLFPNHLYCHLMYIPCTTFRHSFHHCWDTCFSGAPVIVSLHHRMMPPAMQTTC
jgi:hypothetical protein